MGERERKLAYCWMTLKVLANHFVIYLCFHFLHLKIESQLDRCLIHGLLATRLPNYASYLMTLLGPFKSIRIKVFKMLKCYFLATQTIKCIYINNAKAKTFSTQVIVSYHLWQLRAFLSRILKFLAFNTSKIYFIYYAIPL